MATRVLIILISSLVVYSSGQISGKSITDVNLLNSYMCSIFPVSELEEYSTNRTIEENGVFVYSCEVTKELIEIGNDNDTLQVCVNIEQMMQQLDGGFLRLANEIQHARDKVLRSYTHGNEVDGTLAKFKVLHRQDYKNRTEKDPEYVVVIPSGSIVYCSFGPPQETCKDTFLNGSIPLRYIVEGVYTCISFCF